MSELPEAERLRALVADDEAHVRIVLRDLLSALGIDVVAEARNGLEAVDLFHMHQPDLMLLDISMPVMTGEEALMMIMPEYPDACVIMLTSMTDVKSVDTCMSMGAANFIRKDTSLDEIKDVIKETLNL